jgi:peptidoglycan/LPS O-acetylase OafA/YrhL
MQSWRADIEGLRGIAIAFVLIFHAWPEVLPGGFVGVDIFFVISGYLTHEIIKNSLTAGKFSLLYFYKRRVLRLLPTLILVIVMVVVAGPYCLSRNDNIELSQSIAYISVFAGNIWAWQRVGYFDGDSQLKPLLHLWSLGVEEQYYAAYPVLLWVAYRINSKIIPKLLLFVAIMSLVGCILKTITDTNSAFFLPQFRMWELVVGALLSASAQSLQSFQAKQNFPKYFPAVFGLLLILFGGVFFNQSTSFPGWQAAIPVVGAAFLIAAHPDKKLFLNYLSYPVTRWLGRISYAAYLWHWPLLAFARALTPGHEISATLAGALLAVTLVLASACTHWFEKPIRASVTSSHKLLPISLLFAILFSGLFAKEVAQQIKEEDDSAVVKIRLISTQYQKNNKNMWRLEQSCFLDLNITRDFGVECLGDGSHHAPLAVLWGDSHAAHLWQGLQREASRRGWRLAQLTVSQCPPSILVTRPINRGCKEMQAKALQLIKAQHPAVVIMASSWTLFQKEADSLHGTVQYLHDLGVPRVLVLGPVPRWAPSLPEALADDMVRHNLMEPPETTKNGLDNSVFGYDKIIAERANDAGAEFLSLIRIFCDEDRVCAVWGNPRQRQDIFVFDAFHLTLEGSTWISQRIAADIFTKAKSSK